MNLLIRHHYKQLYEKLFKGNGICASDIEYVDARLQLLGQSRQTMAMQFWRILDNLIHLT